jgi:bZIP-type transcription factor MBZ1
MGGYDSQYDDVSNFLNFPNDSDDEDGGMTPAPNQNQTSPTGKDTGSPLSPPNSAEGDAIEEDEQDDDLYALPHEESLWKFRRDDGSLDNQVNPRWLHSTEDHRSSQSHQPSPPTSDDAKTPSERRTALETIQERNEQLIKTATTAKTSKSFPLLPDLLSLKQAEDEDEKILASEEGKRLNPKERRQLRNKVSARNFRVRRKGIYVVIA